jgi:di/tricarboxylate transporter
LDFAFVYTLVLFILLTVVLVKEFITPELAVVSTLLLLLVGQVITVKDAFAGFANEGVLTVAVLYVVAGALENTGILQTLGLGIMGRSKSSLNRKLLRLLFPVAALSAFVNNTPLVAMFTPAIKSWCDKHGMAASRFLLPLSYATILGGTVTLIGTSTNILASGLLEESGFTGFTFFEFTRVAIPAALAGILYLVFFGARLLPDRTTRMDTQNIREFVVALKVTDRFEHVHRTIEEAGLRHLQGLYLFQIERDGGTIAPAKPTDRILVGDRLFFTGLPKTLLELQKTHGLVLIEDATIDLKHYDADQIRTYEAVVSHSSGMVGKNVRDADFRSTFDAVIVAIHRNGERIRQKIGDIVLRPGDTLLLLANKEFMNRWYHSTEFVLVSETDRVPSKPRWQGKLAMGLFGVMVALAAVGWFPLLLCMSVAALLLILTKTITDSDAVRSVDIKAIVTIAASFGVAEGLMKSGVCDYFAARVVDTGLPFGIFGLITALYALSALYTNFITNNTAVILMLPIALATAASLNQNPHPLAIAVVMGANSSFTTPISYQTNLMVYGPGGYRFGDYVRVGLPLQIIVGVAFVTMIHLLYY